MKRPDLKARAERAVNALSIEQVRRLAALKPRHIALAVSGDDPLDEDTVSALRDMVHRLCCARLAG